MLRSYSIFGKRERQTRGVNSSDNGEICGTRFTTNKAPHMYPYYDGIYNSGGAVTLSGDGKTTLPINHTLGSELNINSYNSTCDVNSKVGETIHVENTTQASPQVNYWYDALYAGKKLNIEYTIVCNSGTMDIVQSQDEDGYTSINEVISSGETKVVNISVTPYAHSSKARFNLLFNPTSNIAFNCDITSVAKEITAVQGSVTVFNVATKAFELQTLPLATTYTLKDGVFGTIIKLHTNTFSQADLDAFTAVPERAIDWYNGNYTLPSGIVKGADDKMYYPNNGYMFEYGVTFGNELYKNDTWVLGTDWEQSGDTFTTKKATSATAYRLHSLPDSGQYYISWKTLTRSAGVMAIGVGGNSINYWKSTIGTHTTIQGRGGNQNIEIKCSGFDGGVDGISIKQLTGDYLKIEGTHSHTTTSPYGIQSLVVDNGTLIKNKINVQNGGYVDTRWDVGVGPWSIDYTCELSTGTKEHRVLTYDNSTIKYYVDGVISTPTPALPTGRMKLNNVAAIGFGESVDEVYSNFKVWNKIIVP